MTQPEISPDLNLTPRRSPASVWERRGWDGTADRLQTLARVLIGVAGGALALQAVRRRSWASGGLASLGGGLLYWAIAGQGDVAGLQRLVPTGLRSLGRAHGDVVSEASDESFPASDAPSWTPTTGTGLRRNTARG